MLDVGNFMDRSDAELHAVAIQKPSESRDSSA